MRAAVLPQDEADADDAGALGPGEPEREDEDPSGLMSTDLTRRPADGLTGAQRKERAEQMAIRRHGELAAFKKADIHKITRHECWFLVHCEWLERWAAFARGEADPPGPITNEQLLTEDLRSPREGLQAKIDYRALHPKAWALYVEIYGSGRAPPIARYTVDIYEMPTPNSYLIDIIRGPSLRARTLARRLRRKYMPPPDFEDEEEDCCACCPSLIELRDDCITAFLLVRMKRKRGGKQGHYARLSTTDEDEEMVGG